MGILQNAIQVTVDDNCGHSFCEPFAETVFKGASTPCALCKEPVTKKICNPTCVFGARWRDCASAAVSIQKDAALPASLERVIGGRSMRASAQPTVVRSLHCVFRARAQDCHGKPAHKEECKLTRGTDSMVACKFAVLGCPFESKRSASKDAEQHMIEHTNKHLEMLSGEVEEGGKGYLMEYVLLSEQTHLSEKRTMADGTQVWFKIKPENNDFYNLVVCVNKKKYLQFTANEKEGSCASSSPNPTTGRGWAYWLKAEPGTLLKVEVSNIMVTSHKARPSFAAHLQPKWPCLSRSFNCCWASSIGSKQKNSDISSSVCNPKSSNCSNMMNTRSSNRRNSNSKSRSFSDNFNKFKDS
eukprot:g6154.t1